MALLFRTRKEISLKNNYFKLSECKIGESVEFVGLTASSDDFFTISE